VEQNTVVLKEHGKPVGFQSIVKDITAARRSQELLQQAEEALRTQQERHQSRLQAVLDNIPMIVYIKDLEGRFIMVNSYFKTAFGITDEEVLGKHSGEICQFSDGNKQYDETDRMTRETLKPVEVEDIVDTTDGPRNMLVTKFPLLDKDGKLFATCGVDKDITEMVNYREDLIRARQRAEQAEKLQEEFLANMSHEIRTPMNGIIGMANLLGDTHLTDEQREYVHFIKYSSDILFVLINDILDLSKIKAGRMTVEKIDFNVQEVADTVISPMQKAAAEKNVVIKKRLSPAIQFVNGDKFKLAQVLNNLLSNAVKFTREGEITVSAGIASEDAAGLELEFSVADTGIGISEEGLQNIFESFVQATSETTRVYGGTGLGLAITKRLVELQGGSIHVNSQQGKGSVFTFTIRYDKTDATSSGNVEHIADTDSLVGKRILLVEDNPVNQKVTDKLLTKAGLIVDIASDGRLAIELLEAGHQYDAILMDLRMADIDGFQATIYIRTKLNLSTPIIAMTASALRNEREKCFAIGMNEYISKHFNPKELFYNLRRFIISDGAATANHVVSKFEKTGKVYDLAFIQELEDPDYTCEILELFLNTTPDILKEIHRETLHENWDHVYQAAHKLKGSVGILQMSNFLSDVTEIEELAKEKRELDRVPHLVASITEHFKLVTPMLEAELLTAKSI
jgi:PAS domain S-box-containing protein